MLRKQKSSIGCLTVWGNVCCIILTEKVERSRHGIISLKCSLGLAGYPAFWEDDQDTVGPKPHVIMLPHQHLPALLKFGLFSGLHTSENWPPSSISPERGIDIQLQKMLPTASASPMSLQCSPFQCTLHTRQQVTLFVGFSQAPRAS